MHQQTLPMIGEARTPREAEPEIVAALPTFRSALRHAVDHSGLTQEAIADALEIDSATFSRMLREPRTPHARPREFKNEKLADFMLVTGSIAPLQWLCYQAGRAPVSLRETQQQRLVHELAERRAQAYLTIREEAA